MTSNKSKSVPDKPLTRKIPSGRALAYMAGKSVGIQNYDPVYIKALIEELKESECDEYSALLEEELEQYKEAELLISLVKNEVGEQSDKTSSHNLKSQKIPQQQKVDNLLALVAILTDKVAEFALAASDQQPKKQDEGVKVNKVNSRPTWLDRNGKVMNTEFAVYLSDVNFDGLSEASISAHIKDGIKALKSEQTGVDKIVNKQPFGLKHLKF